MLLALVVASNPFFSKTFISKLILAPVLLFIPGYAMTIALYPKRDDLETIERIALSFGISIAAVPLFGLVLSFTSGIKLTSIMTSLFLFTLILVLIATFRQRKLHEDQRFYVRSNKLLDLIDNEFNSNKTVKDRLSTGILIFTLVLAISLVYFVITVPKIGEKFTEFYILGQEGKADNYSTELKFNSPSQVLIGVANHEYVPVNYTVQVVLEKEIMTDIWFSLDHDETWEQNVTYVPEKTGKNLKLEFWLFKEDNFTAPYRELNMWVNIGT
ncbi:MAG: DUF1616 domain-containing protein [Candidatus Methanoperedens sp.]|nr:DUF1616 domain-containing protein [Candidatus Methanoperedens sp.]